MNRENYHHGNLYTACINTGIDFLNAGKTNFSLREVAKTLNVSANAPSRHFKNKEGLLAAIAEEGFRQMRLHLDKANRSKSLEKNFFSMMRTYLDFSLDRPNLYRVMMTIPNKDEYESLYQETAQSFQYLNDIIKELQQSGKLKKGNTLEKAYAIWAALHGIVSLVIEDNLYVESFAFIPRHNSFEERRTLAIRIMEEQMKGLLKGFSR
ncbi:MAG: TetR/AcrR family transcriptional regulator [Pseudomonadota bacterium]